MQEILTAQAIEGMILGRDVITPEGMVLCGKGTALSLKLIDRLKKMEISHVLVEGRPVLVEGEKTLAEELEEIDRRFCKVEETPPLMYLKKKVKERMVASRKG